MAKHLRAIKISVEISTNTVLQTYSDGFGVSLKSFLFLVSWSAFLQKCFELRYAALQAGLAKKKEWFQSSPPRNVILTSATKEPHIDHSTVVRCIANKSHAIIKIRF